ncbi:hypothetical protein [Stutzerimonas nitrititolerans]|uniref:hypothetical protein n=1 Tax=Stutzerimonas nitrititolerans TaxID=2482751 RepID=UPI0028ABD672|nr:hypothetical protein [Stutzerimonas nitrititolerans]
MQLFVNNWTGTLMAGIGASDTELEIDSAGAARLTGLGSGDYYLLTLARVEGGQEVAWEVVMVTARAGAILSVERGQEGTAALPWPSGTTLTLRVTAGTLAALQESGGGGEGGGPEVTWGYGPPENAPQSIGDIYIQKPEDPDVYAGVAYLGFDPSFPGGWVGPLSGESGGGGPVIIEGYGPPTIPPPGMGAIYIQAGEDQELPLYLAAGDVEKDDWVGPLASYTGRRYIEMESPDSTPLPVSVGRVRVARAAQDPAAVFTLRLPAANRLRSEFMLDFSVSAVAHAGSTLTIAAPIGSTALFSISGPATGHTITSSAITMPMQTMELRVSYCRAYDGQLQVHVLVQHLES